MSVDVSPVNYSHSACLDVFHDFFPYAAILRSVHHSTCKARALPSTVEGYMAGSAKRNSAKAHVAP